MEPCQRFVEQRHHWRPRDVFQEVTMATSLSDEDLRKMLELIRDLFWVGFFAIFKEIMDIVAAFQIRHVGKEASAVLG